jgi:Putative transmembrane protein (PGPGW)
MVRRATKLLGRTSRFTGALDGPDQGREEFCRAGWGVPGMTGREMFAVEMRVVGHLFVDRTRRWALTVVGFALVAVGLAGLVLPVLPGWALIISGFVVLSREYSWANSALAFARRQAARGGRSIREFVRKLRRRVAPAGVGFAADVVLPGDELLIDLTQAAAFEGLDGGPLAGDGAVTPPRPRQRQSGRSA